MDIHNLKASDVLTLAQALEAAVLGYRVRAVDMQDGSFINYNFAGFRINFEGGSSSGWSRRPHDETVAWHVIDEPEPSKPEAKPKDAWGRPNDPAYVAAVDKLIGAAPPVDDVIIIGTVPAAPKPAPAPSVGKWGKALPTPDASKWGNPNKWGR